MTIEEHFQRFLAILKGIQLWHNPNTKPEIIVDVWESPRGDSYWRLLIPDRSIHFIKGPRIYCFVAIHDSPGAHSGDIFGTQQGNQLDESTTYGSIIPKTALPLALYFKQFCGPKKLLSATHYENLSWDRLVIKRKLKEAGATTEWVHDFLDDLDD